MKNIFKSIFKRKKKPVSRATNYDPNTQKPIADYLGSYSAVDAFVETEFEKDFDADNDYSLFDHIKFIINKYKVLIIAGAALLVGLVITLLIVFN